MGFLIFGIVEISLIYCYNLVKIQLDRVGIYMDNIDKVRAKISMYDDEIIKILSKRMDCIDEIMQYKKEKGLPILQPEYEGKKEVALCKKLKDNKYQDEIMNIFRYVVKNAKKLDFITYDEMLELASLGAKVLHNRSVEMAKKYYSEGITLEETASRLYVSEEYLSTQFKKETQSSFTETVRKFRIEKIKDLLLNSKLKLNQIAELTGYSDPKYMSRVFKEEVGMLPTEFRKKMQ